MLLLFLSFEIRGNKMLKTTSTLIFLLSKNGGGEGLSSATLQSVTFRYRFYTVCMSLIRLDKMSIKLNGKC